MYCLLKTVCKTANLQTLLTLRIHVTRCVDLVIIYLFTSASVTLFSNLELSMIQNNFLIVGIKQEVCS